MKYFCENLFYYNLTTPCCIKHLINLEEIYESRGNITEYAKIYTKNIANINESFYTLPIISQKQTVIDIITISNKYIIYYYSIKKYEYAKFLFKVTLNVCKHFEDDVQIIKAQSSLYTNMGCIYEAEGKYSKSKKFLITSHKYLDQDFSSIIIQNNLARVLIKLGEEDEAKEILYSIYLACRDLVNEESFEKENSECLCFILFNACYYLKMYYDIGFSISSTLLGNDHHLTYKFICKVNNNYTYPKEVILTKNIFPNETTLLAKLKNAELNKTKSINYLSLNEPDNSSNTLLINGKEMEKNISIILKKLELLTEQNSNKNKDDINKSLDNSITIQTPTNNKRIKSKYYNMLAESLKLKGASQSLIETSINNKTFTEQDLLNMTKEFDNELKKDEEKEKKTQFRRRERNIGLSTQPPKRTFKNVISKAFNDKNDNSRRTNFSTIIGEMKDSLSTLKASTNENLSKSLTPQLNLKSKNSKNSDNLNLKNILDQMQLTPFPSNKSSLEIKSQVSKSSFDKLKSNPSGIENELKNNEIDNLNNNVYDFNNGTQFSLGLTIIIEPCNDEAMDEAQTYYSKSIKKSCGRLLSIKYFQFYLNNNLGLIKIFNSYKENIDLCIKCENNQTSSKFIFDSPIKNFGFYTKKILDSEFNLLTRVKLTRILSDINVEIELFFNQDDKSFNIQIKFIEKDIIVSRSIPFKKLHKMVLQNNFNFLQSIMNHMNFNRYQSIEDLLKLFIIHHIYLKENNESVAISPDLVGSIRLKLDEFLKLQSLLVDIFIITKKQGKLFIYDPTAIASSICFDVYFDDESFDEIFIKINQKDDYPAFALKSNYKKNKSFNSSTNLLNNKIGPVLNSIQSFLSKFYQKYTNKDKINFSSLCDFLIKTPIFISISNNWENIKFKVVKKDISIFNIIISQCSLKDKPNQLAYQDPSSLFFNRIALKEKDLIEILDINFNYYEKCSEREKFNICSILSFFYNDCSKDKISAYNSIQFNYTFTHFNKVFLITLNVKIIPSSNNYIYCSFIIERLLSNDNSDSCKYNKIFTGYYNKKEQIGDVVEIINKKLNWKNEVLIRKIQFYGFAMIHNSYDDKVEDINNLLIE